jgi:hypothetical protein
VRAYQSDLVQVCPPVVVASCFAADGLGRAVAVVPFLAKLFLANESERAPGLC